MTAIIMFAVFMPAAFADTTTVNTYDATSVGENSAVLNGSVSTSPAGMRVTVYFKWSGGGFPGESSTSYEEYNGNATFHAAISGLLPGRSYSFRAVAISPTTGEVTGTTLSFTTGQKQYLSQQTPTVETRSAGGVTNVSAILNGAVNPQGSADTVRWFDWGTTASFGNSTPKANQGTTAGSFNYSISDLAPNTVYYYRAVAQNSYGLVNGSMFSFQTGGPNYLPTTPGTPATTTMFVITQAPRVVADTGAVIAGTAFPGGAFPTRGWFEWGTNASLGNSTVAKDIGSFPSTDFSTELTSLSVNTTYYYRAVIENSTGRVNGVTLSFTTRPITTNGGGPTTPPPVISKPTTTEKTPTSTATVGAIASCFPNSLSGWLLILLIVILIVIAIDHLVDRYRRRKEEKKRREEEMNKEVDGPRVIK